MTIDNWLYTKITNSTVSSYTTRCYPAFSPSTVYLPYIIYDTIGFERNRNFKNIIYTITSVHNSKANVELLNSALYSLFDNSTAYIRETSSNIKVESCNIINNAVCNYDDQNQYWIKVLDISVWYFS